MTRREKQRPGAGQLSEPTKMGDGRTRYQWRIWATLPSGEAKRLSGTYYGSAKDAYRVMQAAKDKAEKVGISADPAMKVAELLDVWLESRRGHVSSRTMNLNRHLIDKHLVPRIGALRVRALDGVRLRTFYGELKTETSLERTRAQLHSVLNRALDFAVGENIVVANPAKSVKPPKIGLTRRQKAEDDGEVVVWTPEEARALMQGAMADETPFGYAIALGLQTGLRRGELLGLRWKDINWERRELTVRQAVKLDTAAEKGKRHLVGDTKTKTSHRTIPITRGALLALDGARAWQERASKETPGWATSGFIVTTETGGMQHPANLKRTLARLCKAAGVTVRSPHALRHTFASIAIATGTSFDHLSALLGHANVAVTMRIYHHLYKRELRAPELGF